MGKEPLVLVLDDLHEATGKAAMAEVQRLLEAAGERLRLVILTRTDPPLPLYRWRLTGRLVEIRSTGLSFTVENTAEMMRARGLDLSAKALRRLHQVTEGWPAALTLAAASMPGRPEAEPSIDQLGINNHDISDYVRREVLQSLSDETRDVLLRTSILDRVCPDLVAALTWRNDGARLLADLEKVDGLVRHCGGTQSWYRYHQLLRLPLYAELRRRLPEQVAHLHQAASEWYGANGLPSDALGHALAGGDWRRAVDLLERHWPEMLSGRGRSVATAFMPTPPEEASASPLLALAFAVQRRDAGDYAGMRMFLRAAESVAGPSSSPRLARILDGVRLAAAQSEGDLDTVLRTAGRLLAPDKEPAAGDNADAVGALALCATASARFALADLDGMERALRDGMPLARRTGHSLAHVTALGQTALAHLARGRLSASAFCAEQVLGAALNVGLARAPDVSMARFTLAYVCLERGLVDEAEYHLDRARSGDIPSDVLTSSSEPLLQARLHQVRGEHAAGLDVLRSARSAIGTALPPLMAVAAMLLEAELCIADGQLATARRLVHDKAAATKVASFWSTMVATRLYLADGRPEDASALWHDVTAAPRSQAMAVEACLLRASARWEVGDALGSSRLVECSLGMAHTEGIRRPFLVDQERVSDMLVSHLSMGTQYVAMLENLVKTGPAVPAGSLAARGQPVESLTERESVVLRYLGTTLSTVEIAGMLHVSTNTVKTHVKNLYRKLDVGRRRDAVRRGRDLGLR